MLRNPDAWGWERRRLFRRALRPSSPGRGIQATALGRVRDERGAALAIALMVMVICAVLAASSMLTIQTDIQIAVNERIYHEALMSADAGIQWLRTQNLATLSGFSTGQLNAMNATNATIGAAQGIRFTVPQNPTFAWADPTAGGAPVFLVRSRGADRGQRVTVDVEAEIRMAPGAGAVEEAGCITCYP